MRPLIIALLACGCATGGVAPGPLRFHNQPPVWRVNDRLPSAKPEGNDRGLVQYYFEEDVTRPLERALQPAVDLRARGINSLGEVPDSTWFTNRIGRRPLSPEAVRRGPGGRGPALPLRVRGVKVGGAQIGFTVVDADDREYIIKFDEKGHVETESSTDVIVQRLLWAIGYNVPVNNIVNLQRADIGLDDEAEIETVAGESRPMTDADLERYLAMVKSGDTYRALASRIVEGEVIGGIQPEGVRTGDPNDLIPHELRRDLRGQRLFWAWVNNTDLKPQNTLVVYTPEGHMVRYFIDFGKSLGQWAKLEGLLYMGYRKSTTVRTGLLSLVSLGIWVPPWERRIAYPDYQGLGFFSADHFDPAGWEPHHNWRPVDLADRFDEYWAAKIILAVTPAHIRAAIDAAQYTDPRTADYLLEVLRERQRILGRYALSRVASIDRFEASVRGGRLELCFDDLSIAYGYASAGTTRYRAVSFDGEGRALGEIPLRAGRGATTCLGGLIPGGGSERYTIIGVDVRRGDRRPMAVFVHTARGPRGQRVIGVDRR